MIQAPERFRGQGGKVQVDGDMLVFRILNLFLSFFGILYKWNTLPRLLQLPLVEFKTRLQKTCVPDENMRVVRLDAEWVF